MEAMTKVDDSKVDEQFKDAPIENVGSVKYQEEEEEEEYQEEEYQYQEGDGNQQEYNDRYENEEEVRSPFKRSSNNYSDGSKQPKKKKKDKIYPMNNEHNDYHSYYQTPPVPPPALPQTGQDEALSNLMMAWYYSGYYTGLYQVSTFESIVMVTVKITMRHRLNSIDNNNKVISFEYIIYY
jgi:hypothetical protein